mmetsp:Transcript_41366/g.81718  ORF Transcript_41366/g.81718 Transcript_41366/m.81718 type:complete len:347 (+) Transcript_41366:75-1115(+)
MLINTRHNENDVRCRLRFLLGQYKQDAARIVDALRQRVAALEDAGASEAKCKDAAEDASRAHACGTHNASILEALFRAAEFSQPIDHNSGHGGALYDSGTQILRCLARDWSPCCASARNRVLEPVLHRLRAGLTYNEGQSKVPTLWVPGCGMGRLALEAAARFQCNVVANDESTAIVAALGGFLKQQSVNFYPAFDAVAPGCRFQNFEAEVTADDDTNHRVSLLQAAQQVRIEHGDFISQSGSATSFEAVATLFVLDTVASMPAAIKAVACALCPGGMWVNCGPLKKHREHRLFTFEDIASFAEAYGLLVEENACIEDCEYISREVSLSVRELYDVQLFVARKPME